MDNFKQMKRLNTTCTKNGESEIQRKKVRKTSKPQSRTREEVGKSRYWDKPKVCKVIKKAGPITVTYDNDTVMDKVMEDSSDSDSDWEEVADMPIFDESKKDNQQDESVEITLEAPDIMKQIQKKKSGFDAQDWCRLQMNKSKRESQINVHKVHLLCLLTEGLTQSQTCNDTTLQAIALSLVPSHLTEAHNPDLWQISHLSKLVKWFVTHFHADKHMTTGGRDMNTCLLARLDVGKVASTLELVLIFVVLCRSIGLDVRLVKSLQPTTFKANDLTLKNSKSAEKTLKEVICIDIEDDIKAPKTPETENKSLSSKLSSLMKQSPTRKTKANSKPRQSKSDNSLPRNKPKNQRPRTSASKVSYAEDGEGSDIDGQLDGQNDRDHSPTAERVPRINFIDLDTVNDSYSYIDTGSSKGGKHVNNMKNLLDADDTVDHWSEVYLERENKWICVNCVAGEVNSLPNIRSVATQPITYVVGYNNRGIIKDITKRYAADYITMVRKLRIERDWWEYTLAPYGPRTVQETERDAAEDSLLQVKLMMKPFPKSISEFKGHTLYALQRHLLKFEVIYPETSIPLGYIKSEPIYARECVHTLHSRETWLKEGKSVKVGEEPFKTVKSRKRKTAYDTGTEELSTPIFGRWQTVDYIPPLIIDGVVPRNEYGNLEIFKPSMLPRGAVHLRLSGIAKIAKKLEMDFAPAMVGWEQHGSFAHPLLEGIVICEEYKEVLVAAWQEQQMIQLQKEADERQSRVLENWKRIVKGLFLRERMKKKFQLQEPKQAKKQLLSSSSEPAAETVNDVSLSFPQNRLSQKPTSTQTSKTSSTPFPFEIEQL